MYCSNRHLLTVRFNNRCRLPLSATLRGVMMNPLRADFLMTHRAIAAGATLKWPDKPPTDASDAAATKVLPTQAGIQVTLSAAAMEISALLRRT